MIDSYILSGLIDSGSMVRIRVEYPDDPGEPPAIYRIQKTLVPSSPKVTITFDNGDSMNYDKETIMRSFADKYNISLYEYKSKILLKYVN